MLFGWGDPSGGILWVTILYWAVLVVVTVGITRWVLARDTRKSADD